MINYRNGIYSEVHDEKSERNLQLAKKYMSYIYEDSRSYKDAMVRGDYNKAVADAEQVGEKAIKAIAQKNGKLSNTMKSGKHGHDIYYIVRESGSDIKIPKENLRELSNGYFTARYPEGKKKYNKDEAERCGKTACELLDKAIEELDISNDELDKELGGKEKKKNIDDFKSWNRLMK